MRIFDKFTRALSKARFSVVVPVTAALCALATALAFDVMYSSAADSRSSASSQMLADRISAVIAPELAAGNHAMVDQLVTGLAPDTALVTDSAGDIVAGTGERKLLSDGYHAPVLADGEVVGTVHAGRIAPGGLPIPLAMMVSATLIVVGLSYWVAGYFSRIASVQVRELSKTLSRLSAGRRFQSGEAPLLFEEFRYLRADLVRTIRQLRGEIQKLSDAAYTDERTGLGNSARLTQQLTEFIAHSSFEEPAAYVLVDADGLQQFSELHGTIMPHEVHAAMAKRISQFVETRQQELSLESDSWPVFALQSDEFAVLVNRIGARHEVMRFVRNLLDALRQPYTIGGQNLRLPASAGIVMIPEDGQSAQEIRKRAESALFQARRTDHADLHFYSPKLDRQNAARKRLEAEVRAAVENRRFLPVFQPKVDLRTGRIVGAEALARWKLESGRIVSPNVFIPVAEATGLIGDIGTQITEQACKAGARWHGLGFEGVSVAVNVSPLQFEAEDLGGKIIHAMSEAGLPPKLLQLEITESVAVSDPERLRDVIGPLKTMGVKLAIDDFGTGHSNLAMLGRLPFDVFKIDRAFISSLYTDEQAPAIVEMILGMAESLGMETVAEGVETEAQKDFLRRRGCDQYQGYFYSPPVAFDRFIEMLRQDRAGDAADVS
ncbi:putative bifunctional diguanylate cyclase/phosphodiesterase [Henriciella aquimarina]|uniref:putative bifunctional diguanylate cyclase/phosphodiesterase n=1 Tax=Henriciella aquimarina TaxID=545261 RepID=UPI000A04574A|nr:bifunctional diguanylate cyclase/phosphodiesterase [Henriciella aquimarina]